MRLRIGLHSSSRHPVNWSCLHHTDWSVDHTHGTNWWSGRGSWWSKEKLIDPDLIQNLFWVSITLYKRCVLRICRSEQAICIWCHGPPLGRLPSSICFRSWIGVWLFKPILPTEIVTVLSHQHRPCAEYVWMRNARRSKHRGCRLVQSKLSQCIGGWVLAAWWSRRVVEPRCIQDKNSASKSKWVEAMRIQVEAINKINRSKSNINRSKT